jgi:putative aldouronate transport system permease protein
MKTAQNEVPAMELAPKKPFRYRLKKDWQNNWMLYAMVLLPALYFLVFKYGPMLGLDIAFFDYKPARGLSGSKFVGLKHFIDFFSDPYFFRLLLNTVRISLCTLVFSFPAAIILALLINELRSKAFSRVVQTITYIPHFISTVVICGMITQMVGRTGAITQILSVLTGMEPTNMLYIPQYFVPIYVTSDVWQSIGWNSIVYLSALTGIDQQLYEAAKIDGANKWNQILHVTIPGLAPTIVIMFILRVGKMFDVGYEKIMLLYTPLTYDTADVINTYVYRRGLVDAQYSYSTAVGLFNSLVCFTLVYLTNRVARKNGGNSLW